MMLPAPITTKNDRPARNGTAVETFNPRNRAIDSDLFNTNET